MNAWYGTTTTDTRYCSTTVCAILISWSSSWSYNQKREYICRYFCSNTSILTICSSNYQGNTSVLFEPSQTNISDNYWNIYFYYSCTFICCICIESWVFNSWNYYRNTWSKYYTYYNQIGSVRFRESEFPLYSIFVDSARSDWSHSEIVCWLTCTHKMTRYYCASNPKHLE